jgi:hypothetical protein
MDLSFLIGTGKDADRGEKEFKALDKKFKERLGIFPEPESSIISLLTVEKIRASAAQTDTERAEEEVRKQEAKAQAEFNKF